MKSEKELYERIGFKTKALCPRCKVGNGIDYPMIWGNVYEKDKKIISQQFYCVNCNDTYVVEYPKDRLDNCLIKKEVNNINLIGIKERSK